MKYKLITAILTATVAGGTIALLPFKGVNIQPQLDKIHNAEVTMEQASTVIDELLKTDEGLQKENKTLQTQNTTLQHENKTLQQNQTSGNGEGNSDTNYQNTPSANAMLGNTMSKALKQISNYTQMGITYGPYTSLLENVARSYYRTACTQQFVNFYKYLLNNGIYDNDSKKLSNIQAEYLRSTYCGKDANYDKNHLYPLIITAENEYQSSITKNPENVKNMTIPVNDQINMQDIKLPTNLQVKLNKCFSVYTNYCKYNDLSEEPITPLFNNLNWYNQVLYYKYFVEYYTYICAHPEVLGSSYTNANPSEQHYKLTILNSTLNTFKTNYSTASANFNQEMENFIIKYSY